MSTLERKSNYGYNFKEGLNISIGPGGTAKHEYLNSDGEFHRLDGPAYECYSSFDEDKKLLDKRWAINGFFYTEDEFHVAVKGQKLFERITNKDLLMILGEFDEFDKWWMSHTKTY